MSTQVRWFTGRGLFLSSSWTVDRVGVLRSCWPEASDAHGWCLKTALRAEPQGPRAPFLSFLTVSSDRVSASRPDGSLTLAIHAGDARRHLNTSRCKSHLTQSTSLGSWGWAEQTATGVSKSEPLQRRLWEITSLERCTEPWAWDRHPSGSGI